MGLMKRFSRQISKFIPTPAKPLVNALIKSGRNKALDLVGPAVGMLTGSPTAAQVSSGLVTNYQSSRRRSSNQSPITPRRSIRAGTALDVVTQVLSATPAQAPGGAFMSGRASHSPTVIGPGQRAVYQRVGDMVTRHGTPLFVSPVHRTIRGVPRGYVLVHHPTMGSVGMAKGAAIGAGLYRSKPKPPISSADWKKLQVAERVKKKTKAIASKAGWSVQRKGASRRALPAPRKK